jgi:hypothetical protein
MVLDHAAVRALATTFYAIYHQLRAQRLQILDNNNVLRSQAHYKAVLLAQRPWELQIMNGDLAPWEYRKRKSLAAFTDYSPETADRCIAGIGLH